LTDGGIYDNLGLTKLRQLREQRTDLSLQTLILSDAGAQVDWELETRYSSSRARTLLRCADIWQFRINEAPQLQPEGYRVSIHEEVDNTTVPNPPANNAQRLIGRIRTDLDIFSPTEYWFLFNHGYSTAKKVLEKVLEPLATPAVAAPAPSPYMPWNRVGI